MPTRYTTDQLVAPSGLLLFSPADAPGFIEIANSTNVSLTIKTDTTEQYGGDGPSAELLLSYATKTARTGKATSLNITNDGLDLFLPGAHQTLAPTAQAETAQAINGGVALRAGRRYRLGVTPGRPTGAKRLGSVAIKTATTTHVANTDYILDPVNGAWIYIPPTGSACIGAICTSDHTLPAYDWVQHRSSDAGAKEGELWWISDNTAGVNREIAATRCLLVPSGDWALKAESRDKRMDLGWELRIIKPATSDVALYVDGAPYARAT